MSRKIIITALIMAFVSLEAVWSQYQLNFTDNECGNGAYYGVVYVRDSNQTNYGFGFYLFCDVKMELRNLVPPVRLLNLANGTILLDSCSIFMPFSQYNAQTEYHKYIYEIRNKTGNEETIALEYGSMDIATQQSPISNNQMKKINSYFIVLADEDEYAAEYSPHETIESHLFSDSLGNSLYEIKYNDSVVGLRYYCANNSTEYTRFFKGK